MPALAQAKISLLSSYLRSPTLNSLFLKQIDEGATLQRDNVETLQAGFKGLAAKMLEFDMLAELTVKTVSARGRAGTLGNPTHWWGLAGPGRDHIVGCKITRLPQFHTICMDLHIGRGQCCADHRIPVLQLLRNEMMKRITFIDTFIVTPCTHTGKWLRDSDSRQNVDSSLQS